MNSDYRAGRRCRHVFADLCWTGIACFARRSFRQKAHCKLSLLRKLSIILFSIIPYRKPAAVFIVVIAPLGKVLHEDLAQINTQLFCIACASISLREWGGGPGHITSNECCVVSFGVMLVDMLCNCLRPRVLEADRRVLEKIALFVGKPLSTQNQLPRRVLSVPC